MSGMTGKRRKGGSPSGSKSEAPRAELRPWGKFQVLDEGEDYKVKRIEVSPGARLSFQKHSRRSEHWMIVEGAARVTLGRRQFIAGVGEAVDVPLDTSHRIENTGREDLIFIEIQRGSYLGEDDILRLQDDYGRAPGGED